MGRANAPLFDGAVLLAVVTLIAASTAIQRPRSTHLAALHDQAGGVSRAEPPG